MKLICFTYAGGNSSFYDPYTRYIYKNIFSKEYIHSTRDEKTKIFLENNGFKAINTGCPTLWGLTDDLCKQIPCQRKKKVIFTLLSFKVFKILSISSSFQAQIIVSEILFSFVSTLYIGSSLAVADVIMLLSVVTVNAIANRITTVLKETKYEYIFRLLKTMNILLPPICVSNNIFIACIFMI